MCGINGIYINRQVNKKEAKGLEMAIGKMNRSQSRRGPDDEGIFVGIDNTLFLGHCRLSILDLSKSGHQPMEYDDLKITFNGEIYNFLELKNDLEKKGYSFKTKTDTEVILVLYYEYGEKSFSMLRGMFAFGLWDGKGKKLFLVRDRYGIKPLYYYADDEKIIFTSAVKAITKSGLVKNEKNQDAFIGFLLFGSVPSPFTTIKNIFSIPAGHYLAREANGSQKLVQYYDSSNYFNQVVSGPSQTSNVHDIIYKTRSLLADSVNHHLISDVPIGVFLSGGLDSSAVAALAAKSLGGRLKTFSIIFDEEEFSEEYYSDLVAKKIGSDHHKIKITKQDFNDSLDDIFEAMDQPTIDGINTYFIARAAKQAGLKVALSGLGADEIFLGYSHFRRAKLMRLIQQLPQFLKMPLGLASLFGGRHSKLNYLVQDDILNFYLSIRGLFSPREIAKILNIDVGEVEGFINKLNDKITDSSITKLHPVDLLSCLELKLYLQSQLLKDTDTMSMHHSVEVRVPFLDYPLVEYLSSLPSEIKLNPHNLYKIGKNQSLNKPLLAESIMDLLPNEIIQRTKIGFTFPFQKWFQNYQITLLPNYPITKSRWSRFWANLVLTKF